MPGLLLNDIMESPVVALEQKPLYGFKVSHQKVELDIDLATQRLTGYTEITILPLESTLREIQLHARQCVIPKDSIKVNDEQAKFSYEDPMNLLAIPDYIEWTANQYHLQQDRLAEFITGGGTLLIKVPQKVRIEELDAFDNAAFSTRGLGRAQSFMNGSADPLSATPTTKAAAQYKALVIKIPFAIPRFRDGLHFVGMTEGDIRYPHVYTKHSVDPGTASCIFPCVDDPSMRSTWEISIRCSRTLGDAIKRPPPTHTHHHGHHHGKTRNTNGLTNGAYVGGAPEDSCSIHLSDDEKLMEIAVVCSGELLNEVTDLKDSSKKIVSFICTSVVAARHVGFAIGPFEQVDLGLENRETDDEDKLAQGQALPVFGYCLPGRADELRNTCISVVHAIDWFSVNGGPFPFTEHKLVFVDDQSRDVEHTASLSMCRNQLLYPQDIIDPERNNLRILVHALASQWFGVGIVWEKPSDRWATIGFSQLLTSNYMKVRMGTNDYLFRQKTRSDRLVALDVDRPPMTVLGDILRLGPFEYDFLALKAELVLFILDKRIMKASGSIGLSRVMAKIITTADNGDTKDSQLSTEGVRKLIEKITKYRETLPFWQQWIYGAGCPRFQITQSFNKKNSRVQMKLIQTQGTILTESSSPPALEDSDFLRLSREEHSKVDAGELQRAFTGPMTIRIHEADGTPYEHIVHVNQGMVSFEIPYTTKYKRLKRTRHLKERAIAVALSGINPNIELGEEALYYSLGDVLQSDKEMADWDLYEWDQEMQEKMDHENYEWVRVDADFEWICAKEFVAMPTYMYISQLQQDRDVVAHQEAMAYLRNEQAHPLLSTFLVRTLMDSRYFWGIRVMAAEVLNKNAIARCNWIGFKHLEKAYQELFCYPGGKTPQPNNFDNMPLYFLMKAIPSSVAQIRGVDGKCPKNARNFILDQLRFNDNQQNDYSDNFKVAGLLSALAECLIPVEKDSNHITFDEVEEFDDEPIQFQKAVIEELDRHRRMDEWLHSYRNIFTTTVLEGKLKLMKAGVIPVDPTEFAKYTHDGTADEVRLKAFEALLDLGLTTKDTVIVYLMNLMSTNESPYFRQHLLEVFSLGLAKVAFGDGPEKPKEPSGTVDIDGDFLLVENDPTNNIDRKAHIQRTTQIEGALAALKKELMGNEVLKESLWTAVKSSKIEAFEQDNLLDVCRILYDPVDAMRVTLEYPRYLEAANLGKGVVSFKRTERVRLKLLNPDKYKPALPAPVALPPPAPIPIPRPTPTLKLSFSGASSSMPPPQKKQDSLQKKPEALPKKQEVHIKREPSQKKIDTPTKKRHHSQVDRDGSINPDSLRVTKLLRLNVSRPMSEKIQAIQRSPPNLALKRGKSKSSSVRSSPAPRHSPAPSTIISLPSPARSHTGSPAPNTPAAPAPTILKIRKPLPSSAPMMAAVPPPTEKRSKKKSLVVKLKMTPGWGK